MLRGGEVGPLAARMSKHPLLTEPGEVRARSGSPYSHACEVEASPLRKGLGCDRRDEHGARAGGFDTGDDRDREFSSPSDSAGHGSGQVRRPTASKTEQHCEEHGCDTGNKRTHGEHLLACPGGQAGSG